VVAPAAEALTPPMFGTRAFPIVVRLSIESLAPLRQGVELAPLVHRLRSTFPDPDSWSARMRRALVPIKIHDAAVIEKQLSRVALPHAEAVRSYDSL
jgi:hypothetical protein